MKILGALVFAYVCVLVAVYLFQRRLQYFPTHEDTDGKGEGAFVPWRSPEGEFLGYFRPSRQSPRAVVLLFHGNAGEALHRAWYGELIPDDDLVLVLAEYPGYGARPGRPTQASLFAAAEQAADLAARQWGVPLRLVGESLGSGVAVYLASRKPTSRLALISPFSSARAVAKGAYPFLPVGWLMKDPFPSDTFAPGITCPTWIIHGGEDTVVPLALGEKLRDAFRGVRPEFVVLPGVGHSDVAEPLLTSPRAEGFREFLR